MAPQSPILEGDVLTSCHRARLLPGLDNLSYSLISNHRADQNGVYSSPALEPQSSLPFCGIRNEVPTPFCGLALSFVSWYRRACSYSSGPRRYRVPASEPCLNIFSLFIFQTTELKKNLPSYACQRLTQTSRSTPELQIPIKALLGCLGGPI